MQRMRPKIEVNILNYREKTLFHMLYTQEDISIAIFLLLL